MDQDIAPRGAPDSTRMAARPNLYAHVRNQNGRSERTFRTRVRPASEHVFRTDVPNGRSAGGPLDNYARLQGKSALQTTHQATDNYGSNYAKRKGKHL